MTKPNEIIQKLAPGNNIDLEKLARVSEQLAELRRAGDLPQPSVAITRPLGNQIASGPRREVVFANSAPLATAR